MLNILNNFFNFYTFLTGIVADDEDVPKAVKMASDIFDKNRIGFFLTKTKYNNGNINIICKINPIITVTKYHPMLPKKTRKSSTCRICGMIRKITANGVIVMINLVNIKMASFSDPKKFRTGSPFSFILLKITPKTDEKTTSPNIFIALVLYSDVVSSS